MVILRPQRSSWMRWRCSFPSILAPVGGKCKVKAKARCRVLEGAPVRDPAPFKFQISLAPPPPPLHPHPFSIYCPPSFHQTRLINFFREHYSWNGQFEADNTFHGRHIFIWKLRAKSQRRKLTRRFVIRFELSCDYRAGEEYFCWWIYSVDCGCAWECTTALQTLSQ